MPMPVYGNVGPLRVLSFSCNRDLVCFLGNIKTAMKKKSPGKMVEEEASAELCRYGMITPLLHCGIGFGSYRPLSTGLPLHSPLAESTHYESPGQTRSDNPRSGRGTVSGF